jgi:protein ImuA
LQPAAAQNSDLQRLQALRHSIQALERRPVTLDGALHPLVFGIAAIDDALGGGLAPAALHEVSALNETEVPAATGFVCALAGHPAQRRAVLWAAEDMAGIESGCPYGPGLEELGLTPDRLIFVAAMRCHDVLWSMEEGLRSRAIGAVIGEIRPAQAIDDVASRRLALACAERGAMGLFLRASPNQRPLPASTRWVVAASRSAPTGHGVGPPALQLELIRNRNGRLGSWRVEWNRVEQRYCLASTHSEPVVSPAADRPDRAAVA